MNVIGWTQLYFSCFKSLFGVSNWKPECSSESSLVFCAFAFSLRMKTLCNPLALTQWFHGLQSSLNLQIRVISGEGGNQRLMQDNYLASWYTLTVSSFQIQCSFTSN